MYYYIVDPQKISQKEFERVQHVLYSSLSEYRISGEVVRVTGLRTIQQLVENAFAHDAKTIVAVGNDETLHDVINALNQREMVMGFIPLADSEFAYTIGVKDLEQAIKTIAFRRIEGIDLGVVNGNFFLTKLRFGNYKENKLISLKFSADEKFQAKQEIVAGLIVDRYPTDGYLDILLLPQLSTWDNLTHWRALRNGLYENISRCSVLHIKNIEILEPAALPIMSGKIVISRTPCKISVVPKAVRMIVGKDRTF